MKPIKLLQKVFIINDTLHLSLFFIFPGFFLLFLQFITEKEDAKNENEQPKCDDDVSSSMEVALLDRDALTRFDMFLTDATANLKKLLKLFEKRALYLHEKLFKKLGKLKNKLLHKKKELVRSETISQTN